MCSGGNSEEYVGLMNERERLAAGKRREERKPGIQWLDTCFCSAKQTEAVLYKERILAGLLAMPGVSLFTHWEPRYDWRERGIEIRLGDKEMETLIHFADILAELRANMPEHWFRWEFLGADLHGIRANGLPKEVVAQYFDSLDRMILRIFPVERHNGQRDIDFTLWSEVESNRLYKVKQTRDTVKKEGYSDAYLVERMTEARVLKTSGIMGGGVTTLIKASCAPRQEDDMVDLDIPRLHLLPANLQTPWIS